MFDENQKTGFRHLYVTQSDQLFVTRSDEQTCV